MEPLRALTMLHFDWADTPDHVWRDSPFHVDGLHAEAASAIDIGVRDAAASDGPSPIGVVLQGVKGVGKTHLLGLVRRRTHQIGGYFFLDDLTTGEAFWDNTVDALRQGLSRVDDSGESQLTSFLKRVCQRGVIDPKVAKTLLLGHGLTRKDLDSFVAGLRALDRQVALECGDVARALVLYASEDVNLNAVGEAYLGGFDESATGERRKWGIQRPPKSALARVRDVTRLLALTGPIVIGADQLDTLFARSALGAQQAAGGGAEGLLVAQIADGLMQLREVTRRTLTVLTCLPTTWNMIEDKAADSVPDRFRKALVVGRIQDASLAEALIGKRLGVAYEGMRFTPPHPTWPVAPSAFEGTWGQYTPRELFKRLGAHIELCMRTGEVSELTSFAEAQPVAEVVRPQPVVPQSGFDALDEQFERLRASADVKMLLQPRNEDEVMPKLLSSALHCWILEVGNDDMQWQLDPGRRKEVHAQLRHDVDEESDLQEHWLFRTVLAKHHLAALSRLRKARAAAGVRDGALYRHLVLLRNSKWAKGDVTQRELREVQDNGGYVLALSESDVRTFWALGRMFDEGAKEFAEWLVERRPAGRSELLSTVLPEKPARPGSGAVEGRAEPPPVGDGITLGWEDGRPVRIEFSALRKHAAVFAGSGSGKTVLLRRIVEECALGGVSSIVLDPNNDLARLGDAWPEPPAAWHDGDAELADRYLADTDVVVWTPGRANGRPLAFQPLPDFGGVLDDEDEFAAAVEVAVATLAPPIRLTGATRKTNIGLAVLRQAVTHHARSGSRSLPALIDVLSDLPDDVSTLNDARRIAAELAEALKAAMVNDPLFAGSGEPVDPAVLLTPREGKRARVSVINFFGLPAEEQRQNFVNQLQMELFAWIKRNPAGERPLGGLFVMDEAQMLAASGPLTASTRSTIVLASQARKYGLGLLFATQAPKGLHNQVVGNAMTQFFGRLNSPAQIAAANEMARAKGSPVADISRLERAQFYVSGEAFGFRKITTPLCLTHHPASPLSQEEVVQRARRDD